YVGGEGRTFLVDVDELCCWFLEQMARKCGVYKKIVEIYYLMSHSILDEGLRRVYNDKKVLEMAEVVLKHKALDLYVVHGVDVPEVIVGVPKVIVGVPEVSVGVPKVSVVVPEVGVGVPKEKKLPIKKAPTTSPIASHVRNSPRLNKSLTTKDKYPFNEDQQTPNINTTTPASCENKDFEEEDVGEEEEIPFELNEADLIDELREARNKVKKRNAEWYEIA
ncbi:TOM1-like protein 6, partial [Bienertia sinuspersici]